MAGIIPANHGGVENLFEGMPASLPDFQLDDVESFALTGKEQVMETQEDGRPFADGQSGPASLRGAAAIDRQIYILFVGRWNLAEYLAGEGRANGDRFACAARVGRLRREAAYRLTHEIQRCH
jgi:hypothetical protein